MKVRFSVAEPETSTASAYNQVFEKHPWMKARRALIDKKITLFGLLVDLSIVLCVAAIILFVVGCVKSTELISFLIIFSGALLVVGLGFGSAFQTQLEYWNREGAKLFSYTMMECGKILSSRNNN